MATRYYVLRLDGFKPGQTPTLDEVRPFIEFMTIASKDPNALARVQQSIRDEFAKANIQVNLKRYEPLIARLKSAVTAQQGQPPSAAASGAVQP